MVRVLHLMGHSPDFQTQHTSKILAQNLGEGINITTRTIGPGGDYRNLPLGWLALYRQFTREPCLVHTWGAKAFLLAAAAGAPRIIFSPTQFPSLRRPYPIRLATNRPGVHLVCSTRFEQSLYTKFGVPAGRLHVIPPGKEVVQVTFRRSPELRAALGFAEDDYVLLAPGESAGPAGHRDSLWPASILHVLDRRYKMLLWGRGEQIGNFRRLTEKLAQPTVLTLAELKLNRCVEFDELLPAADAVLYTPTHPAPILPIAMCMGAGLPIISTPAPWLADILKDGETCLQVPRRSARMLAQRVIELREQADLASRISGGAKELAEKAFSNGAFIGEYRALYRKFA